MPETKPEIIPLNQVGKYCKKNFLTIESPPGGVVNFLILQAQAHCATAIHIDFNDGNTLVNFRINGTLTRIAKISQVEGQQLVKNIKSAARYTTDTPNSVWSGTVSLTTVPSGQFNLHIIPFPPHDSIIIRISPPEEASPSLTHIPGVNKKIFIWQMGKVGSATILSSITPHTSHYKWDTKNVVTNDHWLRTNNLFHTHSTQTIYNFLHNSNEEFIIISLVRDLLSRNLSSVFQSMCQETSWNTNFIAAEKEFRTFSYEKQEKEITERLRALNLSNHLLSWYDNLFKSHFYYPDISRYHINIFSKPFNHEKGYQTYESRTPRIKMIIMRLEDLNTMGGVLGNFLDIANFNLIKDNISSNKWYRDLYQKFRERYSANPHELDKIYNSRFMRYFYPPKQIDTFRNLWTKK